jgi:uncharacterized membrane protein
MVSIPEPKYKGTQPSGVPPSGVPPSGVPPNGVPRKTIWKAFLGLVVLSSVMIGIYALAFQARLVGAPTFHARFDEMPLFTAMHVVGGGIVLLVGGFQFVAGLRQKHPQLHRWMGRLYLSFVLIGGVGGLVMAPVSDGGLVGHYGFGLLAVLWLYSGWHAYAAIRRGDVETHKAWMLRNFSLAFGAVTLRVYMGLFFAAGVPFDEFYPLMAWVSWVPNLILVEWYLTLKSEKARQSRSAVQV